MPQLDALLALKSMGIKYRNFRRPAKVGAIGGGFETIASLLIFAGICAVLAFYISDSIFISGFLYLFAFACGVGILLEVVDMLSNDENKDE